MSRSTAACRSKATNSAIVRVEWPIVKIVGIAWDCRIGLRPFISSTSAFGQARLHGRTELNPDRRSMIAERFKVGDLVTWNSEAGRVSGTFIKVHTIDVDYKGHTRYASEDDPQYEIKSTKTDHIAMHDA
jgi:hypothetical protein